MGTGEEVGQHGASTDRERSGDGVVGGPGDDQYPAHADAAHGLQLRYLRVEGHLPEGIPRPVQRPACMRGYYVCDPLARLNPERVYFLGSYSCTVWLECIPVTCKQNRATSF